MSEGPIVTITASCAQCKHKQVHEYKFKQVYQYKFNETLVWRAECTKMQVVLDMCLPHADASPRTPASCPYVSSALRLAMVEREGQEK